MMPNIDKFFKDNIEVKWFLEEFIANENFLGFSYIDKRGDMSFFPSIPLKFEIGSKAIIAGGLFILSDDKEHYIRTEMLLHHIQTESMKLSERVFLFGESDFIRESRKLKDIGVYFLYNTLEHKVESHYFLLRKNAYTKDEEIVPIAGERTYKYSLLLLEHIRNILVKAKLPLLIDVKTVKTNADISFHIPFSSILTSGEKMKMQNGALLQLDSYIRFGVDTAEFETLSEQELLSMVKNEELLITVLPKNIVTDRACKDKKTDLLIALFIFMSSQQGYINYNTAGDDLRWYVGKEGKKFPIRFQCNIEFIKKIVKNTIEAVKENLQNG